MRPRIAQLAFIILLAAWSILLVLWGLWSVLVGSVRWPGFSAELTTAGVASIAAGHVVFLACVADRIFPRANRSVVLWMEILSCAVFFIAFFACLRVLLGDGSSRSG
ncbi:MAG: hypothetical protein Kow0022_01980 [Phycisphaerales bacterium]